MEEIGRVTHYFSKIGVGAITLSGELKLGDKIRIKGATTDFEQLVESMQIEGQPVERAGAGDSIGLKLKDRAREGDAVYKLE
ncbi:MAG: translation elongation factor-like protein [Candidatus Acetothermia bacterium]|jgi:putative protease|nr:translation elongation factor-like protein [Candidatus Acetothermia bacterium]MDH7505804.1 translation elongation factor-like protein [Candidatus Acetothermia bacterium]